MTASILLDVDTGVDDAIALLLAVARSDAQLVAVTYGAEGAALFEDGHEIARATPPMVEAVDGTAG